MYMFSAAATTGGAFSCVRSGIIGRGLDLHKAISDCLRYGHSTGPCPNQIESIRT